MPINPVEAIWAMYPNLRLGLDFAVEDVGNGPYIAWWSNPNPRPSQVELDAQAVPVARTAKRKELLLAFKADYAAVWRIDGIAVEEQKDSILAKTAANRTANETALVNQAGTLITKIKSKFADVNNATTEAQVQAITW